MVKTNQVTRHFQRLQIISSMTSNVTVVIHRHQQRDIKYLQQIVQ